MTVIKSYNSNYLLITALSMAVVLTVHADITEIPPEEMTEAYIRDTTVIVPRQKTSEPQDPIHVKISPMERSELDSFDDPNQETQRRPDLTPLSDAYLSEQRERTLQQQQSNVDMKVYDPMQIEREHNLNKIWKEFNIQGDIPKDYGNLTFPTTIGPADMNKIPDGTSYNIGSHEFSISIPNVNGTKVPENPIITPNGEYQINITEDKIQFIMNLPQNK